MNKKIHNEETKEINLENLGPFANNLNADFNESLEQKPNDKNYDESLSEEVRRISGSSIRTISYISVVISISLSVLVSIAISIKINEFDVSKIVIIIFSIFAFSVIGFLLIMIFTWFLFIRKMGPEWYKYKTDKMKEKDKYKKAKKILKNNRR